MYFTRDELEEVTDLLDRLNDWNTTTGLTVSGEFFDGTDSSPVKFYFNDEVEAYVLSAGAE